MTIARSIVLTAAVTAAVLVAAPRSASAYDFSSTNDANRAAGLPHVNEVGQGPGTVQLEFVNTTNTLAFFEVRVDGATAGEDPHPVVIGDVIHPGVCVDGRAVPECPASPVTLDVSAGELVEVRLALGGERNWDFDWTPFEVAPAGPDERRDCRGRAWADFGFSNREQCRRFVETGFDIRDPDAAPRDPVDRSECNRSGFDDYGFEARRDCRRFVRSGADAR
ncbi:MAG: hypothetical protein AAFY28_12065 [Actinomycetota bacterium]